MFAWEDSWSPRLASLCRDVYLCGMNSWRSLIIVLEGGNIISMQASGCTHQVFSENIFSSSTAITASDLNEEVLNAQTDLY